MNTRSIRISDQKEEIETVLFTKDHPYWIRLRQELKVIKKNRQLDLKIRL